MKKRFVLILLLFWPLTIMGYANKIIPGGENIGIFVKEKGVVVIGFYDNTSNDLKIGDHIIKVNDITINTVDDLIKTIKEEIDDNKVELTYLRNGEVKNTTLKLKEIDGMYKTGLYVKDSITGIGTLTYIDPESSIFGTLGHEIINSNTKERISVDDGYIFKSNVTSIKKSRDGNPGGKMANFNQNIIYGDISKNTVVGVYGIYNNLPDKELIEVANNDEIKKGTAYILTTLKDNKVGKYEINIKKINNNSINKNIYFEIVDQQLLKETGGVVQGMSGSPIIQNNKIIGAVTHVIVDDVKTGYGVFIKTMLNEGEKP